MITFKTSLQRLLAVAALMTLGAAVLDWRVPNDIDLGVIVYVYQNNMAVAGAGLAAVILVFVKEWLPRAAGWVVAALLTWIVLPIFLGAILAWAVVNMTLAFYDTPFYQANNAGRLGITIELQDQDFTFAGCKIDGYTATYHIEAQHDQDMMFALEASYEPSFFDDSGLPAQSLQEQLEYVGEADLLWSRPLGVFRIPAGSHDVTVRGDGPFVLKVFAPDPLWTPDLFLAGNEHFLPYYVEQFTRAGFEAAAQPLLPEDCQPLGCPEDRSAGAQQATPVPPEEGAALGPVVGETAIDADGDGRYDALELAITLLVRTKGYFSLNGSLADDNGMELTGARYEALDNDQLCAGERMITLRFDGDDLRASRANGPYILTDLKLTFDNAPDSYFPLYVDEEVNWYATHTYTWEQFAGGSGKEAKTYTWPVQGDRYGAYDQLTLHVAFPELPAGNYQWSGSLHSEDGKAAGETAGAGRVNAATEAVFVFTSGPLSRGGDNTTYVLANVVLTNTVSGEVHRFDDGVYRAEDVFATVHDNAPLAFGPYRHAALDVDGDKLYESLVISATVASVDLPSAGPYTWKGSLLAPDGTRIDAASGVSDLRPGVVLPFAFRGSAIRAAGIDGQYRLDDITITSRAEPAATLKLPAHYTTLPLRAAEFAP